MLKSILGIEPNNISILMRTPVIVVVLIGKQHGRL
jgi:hypothetical protein